MKTLLISFVFGDSKRNGIILGIRHALPNKVKDSQDFPGTYYKEITDDHGQRKIYRYVPLNLVEWVLDQTETNHKILFKALSEDELSEVFPPQPGETYEDEDGQRFLFTEAGFITEQGGVVPFGVPLRLRLVGSQTTFAAD